MCGWILSAAVLLCGVSQAWGVILGIANEAGAKWDKLAQGICLWEASALLLCLWPLTTLVLAFPQSSLLAVYLPRFILPPACTRSCLVACGHAADWLPCL